MVSLVLFLPAFEVVTLQQDMTNRPWSDGGSRTVDYFVGRYKYIPPDEWPIFNSRPLIKWVVGTLKTVAPRKLDAFQINLPVQVGSLWLGLIVIYGLARRYADDGLAFAAPFASALWLCWGFLHLGYSSSMPYDIPAFLFAAAATWSVVARDYRALLLCVAIGTLNKETMIWFIPAYFFVGIQDSGLRNKQFFVRALLLCAVYATAYLVVRLPARDAGQTDLITVSPNIPVEFDGVGRSRLSNNLDHLLLRQPEWHYLALQQNVYWCWAFHLLALAGWFRLPRELRAVYLATPFFLAPLLLFGNICELRLYNEILPLGVVSLLALLSGIIGDEKRSRAIQ